MGEKLERTDRPIEEALESMRQTFIKENGRLLTEDEAIEFIDEMKKDLYRKGILKTMKRAES